MVGLGPHHHHNLKPPSSSTTTTTIKFLCSYGGRIIPRYPDGKLRYNGGETRVLAVDRSISFSELLMKLGELCGTKVSHVRCQLPTEDLDALVSITSDEDLANLIEEYNNNNQKIRAFLSIITTMPTDKKLSPPNSSSSSSSSSSSASSSPSNSYAATIGSSSSSASKPRCNYHHQMMSSSLSKPVANCPVKKKINLHPYHPHLHPHPHPHPHYGYPAGNRNHTYMVHNGNHWQ